jgi:hypothetical protein
MKIKKTLLALITIALLATQMVAATDYTERVNLFLGTASSAQEDVHLINIGLGSTH